MEPSLPSSSHHIETASGDAVYVAAPLRRPSRLGSFEIERVHSSSQSGYTYDAVDTQNQHHVMVEEYFPFDIAVRDTDGLSVLLCDEEVEDDYEVGLTRFLKLSRVLSQIDHAGRVIHYHEQNDTAFYVVDTAVQLSLRDHLETGKPLPEGTLEAVLLSVLRYLDAAHGAEIIHGGITPDRTLVDADGNAFLTGFSVTPGRPLPPGGEAQRAYLSPELLTTDSPTGAWTDLYALGAVLYHAICGHQPMSAEERVRVMSTGSSDPLEPVDVAAEAEYAPHLLGAIDWMLQIPVEERPQSADDLFEYLDRGRQETPRSDRRHAAFMATPAKPFDQDIETPTQDAPPLNEGDTEPEKASVTSETDGDGETPEADDGLAGAEAALRPRLGRSKTPVSTDDAIDDEPEPERRPSEPNDTVSDVAPLIRPVLREPAPQSPAIAETTAGSADVKDEALQTTETTVTDNHSPADAASPPSLEDTLDSTEPEPGAFITPRLNAAAETPESPDVHNDTSDAPVADIPARPIASESALGTPSPSPVPDSTPRSDPGPSLKSPPRPKPYRAPSTFSRIVGSPLSWVAVTALIIGGAAWWLWTPVKPVSQGTETVATQTPSAIVPAPVEPAPQPAQEPSEEPAREPSQESAQVAPAEDSAAGSETSEAPESAIPALTPTLDTVNTNIAPVVETAPTAPTEAEADTVSAISNAQDEERANSFRELERLTQLVEPHLAAALNHFRNGRYLNPSTGSAYYEYSKALAIDPDNEPARNGIERVVQKVLGDASTAIDENRLSEARTILEDLAKVEPTNVEIDRLRRQIEVLEEKERQELARQAEEERQRQAELARLARVETLLNTAGVAYREGRMLQPPGQNALEYYRKVLELDANNQRARNGINGISDHFVQKARTALAAGDFTATENHLVAAAAVQPDNATVAQLRQQLDRRRYLAEQERQALEEAARIQAEADRMARQQMDLNLNSGISAYYQGAYREAYSFLAPLAERGVARAQFRVAVMLQNGRGVDRNPAAARQLYLAALVPIQKAAENGETWAQADLGSYYEEGLVLQQSYQEAARWYELAAKQGYAGAQTNLGVLYANGKGVAPSLDRAVDLFRLAAAQGDAVAKENLRLLGKSTRNTQG